MSARLDVILTGPPGSGKGTQAALLADKLGIAKVSTGDILREAVSSGSELGRKVQGIMASGALVPDEVVVELVRERLSRSDAERGYILDGFPRTRGQAESLDGLLESLGRSRPGVVALDVPDEEIKRRILARGEGRADDHAEVVERRLRVYRAETRPVLDHYKDSLIRVHGVGTVEEIQIAILEALGA